MNAFFEFILPSRSRKLLGIIFEFRESTTTLENEIEDVNRALLKSSELITKLQGELTDRTQRLEELQAQYQRYSELVKLEETQINAIVSQMDLTLEDVIERQEKRDLLIQIFFLIVGFILGVLFTEPFRDFINNVWSGISSNNTTSVFSVINHFIFKST